MILKEKELFEYIKCPLRYSMLKNGADIDNNKSYNQFLYEVAKVMYISTAYEPILNSKILKNKWDSICSNNKEVIAPKQTIEGWGYIYSTFNYINNTGLKFVDVDIPYNIDIPGTGVTLTGQLSPIIDNGDHIEIFISSYSKKLPSSMDLESNLKYTIDAYAIKKMFNKDVIIRYHSYAANKDLVTLRNEKHFARLESIIKNVGTAINSNIIYPRETYMCSSCVARDICTSWTGK